MNVNWIFCSDRLPEKSGKVIVCNKEESIYIVNYSVKHKQFNNYDDFEEIPESEYLFKDVIAWMPLPEPPSL